jgi:hypothetical protein
VTSSRFRRRRSRDDREYAEYLGQLTTASYDGTASSADERRALRERAAS